MRAERVACDSSVSVAAPPRMGAGPGQGPSAPRGLPTCSSEARPPSATRGHVARRAASVRCPSDRDHPTEGNGRRLVEERPWQPWLGG